MKNLIVYYSRKGENYWAGGVRNLEKGNTERVAEFVQEAVGGDLFEIETVKEYAADYYQCIDEAKAELQADARPEIKRCLEDVGLSLDDYDTIFLGYPNWWGTCPMCVFTFLERYDLAGKRIIPFCTNEGSGMGGSEKHLKKICARRSSAAFPSPATKPRSPRTRLRPGRRSSHSPRSDKEKSWQAKWFSGRALGRSAWRSRGAWGTARRSSWETSPSTTRTPSQGS